jgi:hypothetical protein
MSLLTGRNLSALMWLLGATQCGRAQSTFVVLNTGNGQPLVSVATPLFVDAALVQPRLQFNFGFATDEISTPGTFLDSLTVTIQNADQSLTAVYLTSDASGTVLAPPTPGSLLLDAATINTSSIAYPSLQPVLANPHAFLISAAIPPQFVGGPINVFFDLFDNQNPIASQGWYNNLQIVSVPEPQAWTLLLLAGVACWTLRGLRK